MTPTENNDPILLIKWHDTANSAVKNPEFSVVV
jgi:hypothetical protein